LSLHPPDGAATATATRIPEEGPGKPSNSVLYGDLAAVKPPRYPGELFSDEYNTFRQIDPRDKVGNY